MKMVKYKRILAAACIFAAMGVSTVGAADTAFDENELITEKTTTSTGDQVFPDSEELAKVDAVKTGSIQVMLTDGKAGTEKSNVKIICQKVADIMNGEYVLTDTYKKSEVDLNAIENANDLKTAAEKLLATAGESTSAAQTDAEGFVTFKNLEVGVYLIYAQDTETYDTVEPSLIAVPTWNDSEGEMQYDVMIAPKHTEKPEKEDNVAPQTSLQENTWKYVTAAGICVCGALFCTILYKRKH